MKFPKLKSIFYSALFACSIAFLTALFCQLFSAGLELATDVRKQNTFYPFLAMPFVGSLIYWIYQKWTPAFLKGNNLVLDEIKQDASSKKQSQINILLVPLITIAAWCSHFVGASVGREGVGAQIGAAISDFHSKLKLKDVPSRKDLLRMGVSAGFTAIFNTPFSGGMFGVEFSKFGDFSFRPLFLCFATSLLTYFFKLMFFGFHYEGRGIYINHFFTFYDFVALVLMGIMFGLCSRAFIWMMHGLKNLFQAHVRIAYLRPFVGGCLLTGLYFLVGSDRYHGLGQEIVNLSFIEAMKPWDFLLKMLTTTLSISAGFLGGEVMSLFYIGATLGNVLSPLTSFSFSLASALGFVSVFAGALNTPFTAIFLTLELFHAEVLPFALFPIFLSYLFSGNKTLFASQESYWEKPF